MTFLLLQPRLAKRFLNRDNLPFWMFGAILGSAPLLWWIFTRFQEFRGALTSTGGENAILVNLARQSRVMGDLFMGMYGVDTAVLGGMFRDSPERLSPWPLFLAIVIAVTINTLRLRMSLFHHVTRGMLIIPLWIVLSMLFWAFVPDGGKPHHLLPLYVLAVLWMASILAKVTNRLRWPFVTAVILLCISANLVTIGRFHSQLAVDNGHNRWSTVTSDLARIVKQTPHKQFIFLDWGLLNPVYTLANGPSNVREFVWAVVLKNPAAESQIEAMLNDPKTVFVKYNQNYTMFSQPREAIFAAASSANMILDCQPFLATGDSEPLVELCTAQK
jgi:hypothetical protein